MAEQLKTLHGCPYLGLVNDPESRFSYPEPAHRCFVGNKPEPITLDHQANFCVTKIHYTCPLFQHLASEPDPSSAANSDSLPQEEVEEKTGSSQGRIILWGLLGLILGILVILGLTLFYGSVFRQNQTVQSSVEGRPSPVATLSVAPPAAEGTPEATATPVPVTFLATPTPTATPMSDAELYTLSPEGGDMGWVTSGEQRGHHFGDSYLYAGVLDGQIYVSAFQFNLSEIPRGAPIHSASIQLTGLDDSRLGQHLDQPEAVGAWSLRLLASEIDQDWRRHNFQNIFNALAVQTLTPILGGRDLAVDKTNVFELTPEQIRLLETRIIEAVEGEDPTVSFRLDGPVVGSDNLFAWDTGYGSQSRGNRVTLSLEVGPPPATPPPYQYVLITSTPTPENVVTAAAIVAQITAEATRLGTATPLPPNMVTPTPIPDYLVIVPTPIPGNLATAAAQVAIATAEAIATGTPPPLPTNAVTATPTPTQTPTFTPSPVAYVLITSTPTPESVLVAATLSVIETAQARRLGTPTPLPENWATPVVVTSTPTPLNNATAQAMALLATAVAYTTGTPTPTPSNMVTATPTPVFEIIPLVLPLTPLPPSPTPGSIPAVLLGKVLFRSDRDLADQTEDEEHIYVFDPATGELGRLSDSWPYEVALDRDTFSADKRFRVFTKDIARYQNVTRGQETVGVRNDVPAVFWYDSLYDVEGQLTQFGAGIAYGGVWSPTSEQIAFVSNDSGDDEIWIANRDGSDLRALTNSNEAYNAREIGKDTFIPEVNRSPSWSPDGSQIVFASTRTGNYQLWVMNADGSDQRLLMGWDNWTPYNDQEPVWVKYSDPAPPLN